MILFKKFKCAVVSHSVSLAFTHRSLIDLCISGLFNVPPYLAIEFLSHHMTGGGGLIYAPSGFYYLSHE